MRRHNPEPIALYDDILADLDSGTGRAYHIDALAG
mgnify:FL=1